MSTAIACDGVGYRYGNGVVANRDVDLVVRSGEIFCLLGENGAGKSTLIRQIVGELRPHAGSIRVLGLDPFTDADTVRRRMGVIPQSVGLFDGLHVERHLTLFAPLKGVPANRASDETTGLLELCGLAALRRRRVGELSGGERRKLLVALALLGGPDLLVLDEPTVGLDPVARRTVWEILRAQQKAGRTVLLTTHYLDEAEQLADRVAFIHAGRVRRVGSIPELLTEVDRGYRLVVHDATSGAAARIHWFRSLGEAHAFARTQAFESFSVGPVSLEDLYLRMIESWSAAP